MSWRSRATKAAVYPNRAALDAALAASTNGGGFGLIGGASPYEVRQSNGRYWDVVGTSPFTPSLRCVSANTAFPNNYATASKQIQCIRRHTIWTRTKTLKARFVNKYVDPADWTEKSPGAASTITCGLIIGGVNRGSFKIGGNASMSVADGATADTDDFDVGFYLYPGDVVYTVTFLQNAVGIPYEGNTVTSTRPVWWDNPNGEVCQVAASGLTDQTTTSTGTLTGGSFTGGHGGPFALLAMSTDPAILILGDSEEAGISEAFLNVPAARGVYARSLAGKLAYAKMATGGDGAVKFVASHTVRAAMKDIFTHVVTNYGINDLTNFGQTPAGTVSNLQSALGNFTGLVAACRTLTPDSSSSDNWTTTGNQTPHAQAANINSYNNLLRAVPSGFVACFETSDVVSTARDSNIWLADGVTARLNTPDGLHLTANASELVRLSGAIDYRKMVAY